MDYSVVMLTFNSVAYVETSLESLRECFSNLHASYEIFVYDNGSRDGTVELLKRFADQDESILPIFMQENRGTTVSRNTCLRRAKGDYVIVLDSDAYVNSNAIAALRSHLDENKKVGMVVPKLIYPDGRYQLSTDEFPTLAHKLKRYLFLKRMERKVELPVSDEARCVDYAISAVWMMRRSLLEKVGLLDEKIFYSPEDVDYCIRVWLAGLEIHYLAGVSIVHDAQEISRSKGIGINSFTLSHASGLFYLFRKHKYGIFGSGSLKKRIHNISAVDHPIAQQS